MPPSTFAKKLLFLVFIVQLGIVSAWFAGLITHHPRYTALVATLCDLTAAFLIWASGPLFARFFVRRWCDDPAVVSRVKTIAGELRCQRPIRLIDSEELYASTLGITESSSRIYLTTGLLARISDDTLRFVIAHEMTHAREQHILLLFFAVVSASAITYIVGVWLGLVLAILYFFAFRRYFEFRADAGAKGITSPEMTCGALRALETLAPGPALQRYAQWLFTYPTYDKRIHAVTTNQFHVF